MADRDPQERRAPVQGDGSSRRDPKYKPPGTVSWTEHVQAWETYRRLFGFSQDALRIAERGGFGYAELRLLLGRDPETWRPL